MRLRGKYNIGVLFLICFAVSLLLPVSVAYSNKGKNENLPLTSIAPLLSGDQTGFIDRYIDFAFLKKIDKAAHPHFGKVLRRRRMIPEEDWITKIIFLNNAATFAEYDSNLHSRCSWVILPASACPQGFLLAFSGRSPPSA